MTMAEHIEDQAEEAGQGFDLQRYLNIARRRHMQFLVPAFLGWVVVWGSSWFLQARYKSATTILVEQPSMPKNYVLSNVNDDLQGRLQSIKQQVLSRTRLLMIIDKFHLYAGGRRPLTPDEKVARMGSDIDLELIQDARTDQITGFTISYWATNPYVAQEVASEISELFINENLKVRQHESESNFDFIKSQLAIKAEELAKQEQKVKEFQAGHEGELPEQQPSNLQILASATQERQSANGALATAKQQREFIQTEISEYKTMHVPSRSPDGKPTGLAAIDLQLDQLNAKLTDLLSSHTEQYPDVIAVRQQIASTQRARDAMDAEQRKRAAATGEGSTASDDPTISSSLMQLQAQLHANQLEISGREREISDLNAKIAKYEGLEVGAPAVAQQLADLSRGYEQSKKDYDELQKKKSDMEQSYRLEVTQQGEQFKVLDPASLPLKPDFPKRLKLCGMGLGVGIGLGLLVVVALEFFDDRMHSEADIKAMLPVAVLSEIPEVFSPSDLRAARRKMVISWVATGIAVVTVLAGSALSYLKN